MRSDPGGKYFGSDLVRGYMKKRATLGIPLLVGPDG
jgi:hypothetical protein